MAKSFTGMVTSDKADKTIVVTVVTRKTHPIYKKQYSISTKFMAHDEENEAKIGDRVLIEETRPISLRKHFKLVKIVEHATIRHEEVEIELPQKEKQPIVKAKKSKDEEVSSTEETK